MTDRGRFLDALERWRLPAVFSGLTIFASAISISYTQSFLGLALLFTAIDLSLIQRVSSTSAIQFLRTLPPSFLLGLSLFAWLVLSFLVHFAVGHASGMDVVKGESGDLFLCIFGILVWGLSRDPENRKLIVIGLIGFIAIILVSGSVAVFSEQRLAYAIYGRGFLSRAIVRPQHFLMTLGDLRLYRPLGFMPTRLTFAGVLVLILPLLLPARLFEKNRWGLVQSGAGILGTILILINGTRSALVGFGVSILLFGFAWLQWSRRIVIAFAILLLVGGFAFKFSGIESMLMARQTDFQRPIIWTGAFEIFKENPGIGVGPNHFREATLAWRAKYALEHPTAWYYLESTPSGHAHNDLLNFLAIGGIPAGLIFLGLIVASASGLAERTWRSAATACGAVGFFIAGLGQCYFQDDSVVIVYWFLLGIFYRSESPPDSGIK